MVGGFAIALGTNGCATPQYSVRPTPAPEESVTALQIERAISRQQAQEFEQQGARPIDPHERPGNLLVQEIVSRLSRVTERPSLNYRAYLYNDKDPNAAALADGRVYISTGMIEYLASRGGHQDELAFILGHEFGHTVAQHLVKRYRMAQQQQLVMAVVSAGAAAVARNASPAVQQAGRLAVNAAQIWQGVRNSGYSQEQELEADQLGIRYAIRAGYDPQAALDMLEDFARFDSPSPFLRTHPYMTLRREYLLRYLVETGQLRPRGTSMDQSAQPFQQPTRTAELPHVKTGPLAAKREELRKLQKLYPVGSVSWKNLQRQIDSLK